MKNLKAVKKFSRLQNRQERAGVVGWEPLRYGCVPNLRFGAVRVKFLCVVRIGCVPLNAKISASPSAGNTGGTADFIRP